MLLIVNRLQDHLLSYRKGYYSKEKYSEYNIDLGHTELIIAKNRQGITSTKYFNFDSNCLLFNETDHLIE
ncbi:MAG: DnaB-like helicase C-terminal domain-containing protein [Sweet potato little leaf phytoplasma]|nr:DnaB-like helicase C-terminal domain-containing protein [Sweet potato little leaf phytoplasma]